MSLDLIREVVCSKEMRSFMFVGSYRSNEVDQDHPLVDQISQIQGSGVPILNIELSNMSKDSINALVSNTLKLSPLLTRPLSDAVYSKTSGNCLFVIELLSDLHRQNLLRYSVSSRRWEWDDDAITALEIKSNVVDLMRRKLLRLGATEMWSVKVVACLGALVQQSTLELLSKGLGLGAENGLTALLHRPIEEGILIKVGSTYRFSHDQIQQAAYSLVSASDRPSFHLKLGRSFFQAASGGALGDDSLFTCVDQLNRGSSEISAHSEKILVAQLNLQAAKNASATSAFLAASLYLRSAKAYLEENDWQNNYTLCLEVYTALSETEYITGDYEEMTATLNQVFSQARNFDDKLRAHYTMVSAFASKQALKSALEIGFKVLGQLGEPIDTHADRAMVTREMFRTKSLLMDKDKEWFVNQRMMSDHHKRYAMKFLHLLFLYVYMAKAQLAPMLACKMIDLTVRYGLCSESAYALAAYAAVICGFLEDYTEAYRAGKVAHAIIDKLNAPTLRARVYPVLYGVVNHWIEPLHSTLAPLVDGHDAGIASGDPEYAMVAMQLHNISSFQCGDPLPVLLKNATTLVEDCKRYRLDVAATISLPTLQCIENLIGVSGQKDPTLLEGDSLQGSLFLAGLIERGHNSSVCQYYYFCVVLAYIFGQDELSSEMYDKLMEYDMDTNLPGRFTLCVCAFYGCLAAISMQRKQPEVSKWQKIIERNISRIKRWSSFSLWNSEHKLLFLEAEQMANAGDQRGAVDKYEEAIRLARKHRFVNEEAVICERYSAFLLEAGDKLSAGVQRTNAYGAYERWGALRKCEEMKKEEESSSSTNISKQLRRTL